MKGVFLSDRIKIEVHNIEPIFNVEGVGRYRYTLTISINITGVPSGFEDALVEGLGERAEFWEISRSGIGGCITLNGSFKSRSELMDVVIDTLLLVSNIWNGFVGYVNDVGRECGEIDETLNKFISSLDLKIIRR